MVETKRKILFSRVLLLMNGLQLLILSENIIYYMMDKEEKHLSELQLYLSFFIFLSYMSLTLVVCGTQLNWG